MEYQGLTLPPGLSARSPRIPFNLDTGNIAIPASTFGGVNTTAVASAFLLNNSIPGPEIWLRFISLVVIASTTFATDNQFFLQACEAYITGLGSVHKRGLTSSDLTGQRNLPIVAARSQIAFSLDCDVWVKMEEFLASLGGANFGGPYVEIEAVFFNQNAAAQNARIVAYGLYQFYGLSR